MIYDTEELLTDLISLKLKCEENIRNDNEIKLGSYGTVGWTIEEKLCEAIGLESTNSIILDRAIDDFDLALDREDKEAIVKSYNELNEMLHPKSKLRKIIDIQMCGWR